MEQHQMTLEYKSAPPLAHKNDPITSYEAADKMIKSGKLSKQEEEIYCAILRIYAPINCEFTAKQLSDTTGINYYTIQRRLSGLRQKSKIERTGEKRDGCCVWRLK